jgi:hypothetical protein
MPQNMCKDDLCPLANSVFDVVNSGGVRDDVGFGDGFFEGRNDWGRLGNEPSLAELEACSVRASRA